MRYFYLVLVKIYNLIFSFYEELFLFNKKNFLKKENLIEKGYQKFILKEKVFNDFQPIGKKKVNLYFEKFFFHKEDLRNIISKLFIDLNLKNIITEITGYNYTIDFFTAYKTFSIEQNSLNKNFFANKWHIDKPFSKNTLKIVIPVEKIDSKLIGGIKIIEQKKSKNILNQNDSEIDKTAYYQMISEVNEVLVFNPNKCLHAAGNPSSGYSRTQIIIQLNPSKKWKVNKNLFKKQYHREPKFPFFAYLFDRKEDIV